MLDPRYVIEIKANGIHINSDKNDRFVLRKCAIYLERFLCRHPRFDKETLKFLFWILGEQMQKIGTFVLKSINGSSQSKLKEDLLACDLDPDDYAHEVTELLRKAKSISKKKLSAYAIELMKAKYANLSYRGKSEIEKNVIALKKMFNLTDQETELCSFYFIATCYDPVEDFFIDHLECNKFIGQKHLIDILQMNRKELHEATYGKMKQIGVYEIDKWGISLEDEFFNLIQNPLEQSLSKNFYTKAPRGSVSLEDYFIGKEKTRHILDLLNKKTKTGTHILLYGPPGTGKTSFAHSLSDQLDAPSYEIVRGEENTAVKRRAAIVACLNMTGFGEGSIVLADEADNLLNTSNSWFMRGEIQDKGWLNQLLEKPGSRMIWITNSISGIESSVLRRFAYSLHFRPFNRRQRIQLWNSILRKNKCKRLFSQKEVEYFAKKYPVNAGIIDLAVKKSLQGKHNSKAEFHRAVELALIAHETLLNDGERKVKKDRVEKQYSLEGLNVKGDVKATLKQLKTFDEYLRKEDQEKIMNMNLLFYGPPGTGKSELARYIAEKLDREVICKRVSDIQDKYVGETEKNIRNAFLEAEREEAILVVDEADSLLFSRDRAVRSWEISFVNEFLTQMERFRGILICTTNRLKDLDQASIRRFNHKIGFDYLTASGNQIFYDLFLGSLANNPLNSSTRGEIKQINHLTPGDFKVVRDRYSFYPSEDVDHNMMVEALQKEADIKAQHHLGKKIGF